MNNLLLSLRRCVRQQDENFTTEAFVHLCCYLQAWEPHTLCFLLDFLSGAQLKLTPQECSTLMITTQNVFVEGRTDILISGGAHFVIIEVKVESEPGWDQLDRYRKILRKREEANRYLLLLSRYPVHSAQAEKVDCHVRWAGVARKLGECLKEVRDETSRYLIQQFLEYLSERGIAMEKVGWELVRGVQSLLSLMDMLGEGLKAAKVKEKQAKGSLDYNGRYFAVDGTECWSGVYYSNPESLVFEAYDVSKAKVEGLGFGQIQEHFKGRFKWSTELDLGSEEVHFFALSPDHQQARINDFISRAVSAAKNLRS